MKIYANVELDLWTDIEVGVRDLSDSLDPEDLIELLAHKFGMIDPEVVADILIEVKQKLTEKSSECAKVFEVNEDKEEVSE